MIRITLNDLFNLQGSVIYNPDNFVPVKSVSIDSRTMLPNSIFVAIKGEKFDGHNFVSSALNNGATSVLINNSELKRFSRVKQTIITVNDTKKALGELAAVWRKKLSAKVISLTGSNGKTSTKEILFTLLSEKYNVVRTISNNNNHIGVPLTIFSANHKTEYLVLEHGTNHFNEIEYTAKIASPDFGLITNIGTSHLEYLKNKKGVFDEKKVLLDEVRKNNGIIFINNDDELLKKYSIDYKKRITFSFNTKSDVSAKILHYTKDGKTLIQIISKNKSFTFESPLYGLSNARNILAAITICMKMGLTPKQIMSGVKKLSSVKGRMSVSHIKSTILIDDTYNANPESMKAALDVVKKIKIYKDKYLILGDMFELGEKSAELHKSLGKYVISVKPKKIFLLGENMKNLAKEISAVLDVVYYEDRNKLGKDLKKSNFNNSVVLIKGSRGMKMEEYVELIKMELN